jgi:hypothetical protein
MRLFENFAIGSNCDLQGYLTKELSSEDKKKALSTNKMLVKAMEQSCIGPKVGTLNLHKREGTFAFLRAAQIFFPGSCGMSQDFDRTIASMKQMWTQSNKFTNILSHDVQAMFEEINKTIKERVENQCSVSRAQINPIIIFLCLDHGVNSETVYTPMASPIANGRSLVTEHVNSVCGAVLASKASSIIANEDFSITPYYLFYDAEDILDAEGTIKVNATETTARECTEKDVLDEKGTPNGIDKNSEEGPRIKDRTIHYKCILNRERHSSKGHILGRTAVSLTVDNLIKVYEVVSLSRVCTSHTVGSCRLKKPSSFVTFFITDVWTYFTHGRTCQLEGQTNERACSRILQVFR